MANLFDTSALMIKIELLDTTDNILIPYIVIEELDNLKDSEGNKGANAREAIRKIKSIEDRVQFVFGSGEYKKNDDEIIQCAVATQATLFSGDYGMLLKAHAKGVSYVDVLDFVKQDEYSGYKEITTQDSKIINSYDHINHFDLLPNQYLIVKNTSGEIVDVRKWTGEHYVEVKSKSLKSEMFGSLTPKDMYQRCAIESLMNHKMTMIKGKAGSGKSLISLSYAQQQIEKGKFNKLICFVNPLASRNSAKLGFYPGDRNEKLLDSAVGSMLASKFGSKIKVEEMIAAEDMMLLPFSDIRGFDTTGMKAIVYIIEAQNLDVDLMKLAVQRVGEDSKLIIDGDYTSQVDSRYYEGINNGMRRVSEVFRGTEFYGEVELPFIYRSVMAAKADEM